MAAGREGWSGWSTERLIAELVLSGLDIPGGLHEELLRRGSAIIPYLTQILDNEKYWRTDDGATGSGWTPIAALQLLAAVAEPAGLEPVLRTLYRRPDELGDWLTEDIPSILACFGRAAAEPVKELISNQYLDVYVRLAGSEALSIIAREHPDCKDEIVQFLETMLSRENEDKTFISFCACDLADIREPTSKAAIRTLFEQGRIDEQIVTWEQIEVTYSSSETGDSYVKRKPLEFFTPENLNCLKSIDNDFRTQQTDQSIGAEQPKEPGRNDPCPCGSGKKYKKCCLPKLRSQKTDKDEQKLRHEILNFAASERFGYDLKTALNLYRPDAPNPEFEDSEEEVEFIDWFIHDYRCMGSGQPLIVIFAREKAGSLNGRQRRILAEWQNTLFGVYEVVRVLKGEGVGLKDIITEEEYFVKDVSTSNAAILWDILVARIISVDGTIGLGGIIKLLPQRRKRDLKTFLETQLKQYQDSHKGASYRDFLRERSLTVIQYACQPRTPELKTAEGDDLYLARVLYGLKDREAVRSKLDKTSELILTKDRDDGRVYSWLQTRSSIRDEENRSATEGHRVLGIVTLTPDSLEVECLSKERLSKLRKILEQKLPTDIIFLADLSTTMEAALKRLEEAPISNEPTPPTDEMRRAIEKELDHYYLDEWTAAKIPALHNETPTQAAKSEDGRAALTQLLNELQNMEERKRRNGDPCFDVNKLRSRLGIPNAP